MKLADNSELGKAFYTTTELSAKISVPPYTIRKLVREGRLPAYQITGRGFLYDEEEVIKAIKSYKVGMKLKEIN